MLKIADCESGGKQFYPDGSLVRDSVTGTHVGVYQLSTKEFAAVAASMNEDIYTEQGNIAFALQLYKLRGTAPWLASEGCWSKTVEGT